MHKKQSSMDEVNLPSRHCEPPVFPVMSSEAERAQNKIFANVSHLVLTIFKRKKPDFYRI